MPVVGSAEIIVTAITAGFKQQIKQAFRDARPEAAKEGERYGKAFGDKFRMQLKNDMRKSFRENRDWIKQEGARQGKAFGTEFAKSLTAELRVGLADAFEKGLGDPGKAGEEYGERFADAVKRGAKQGKTVSPEDLIGPVGDQRRRTPRLRDEDEDNSVLRVVRARAAQNEITALAQKHEDDLYAISQKAADDLVGLERAKLTRIATERDRKEAADNDQLSEHLAKVLKAAQQEEAVAQHLADFSAEQHEEAQAQLAETIAKMKAAEREVLAATLKRDGPREGRRQLAEAEQRYNELRDLYERSATEAKRAERERLDRENAYLLALEAVKDRNLELDDARRKKKSTAVATAAINDAKVVAEAARKEFEAAARWSEAARKREIADAEETAEALQRVHEADEAPGVRINALTYLSALKNHAKLKQLAEESARARDEAAAQWLADYQAYTEAEYELARRRDELIEASGRQRVQAQRDYDSQALATADALARARQSADVADVADVRRERVIIDVDRSQFKLDFFDEGRRAGLSFSRGFSPAFKQTAEQAQKAWSHLFRLGNALGPAIAVGVGAIVSLGAGLVSLAASAAQAAGSLIVLPGIIGALGQAAITAAIAMKGVGEAIGAGFKATEAAAAGGTGATLAQARAIADARKALSRAYEDGARRMRDANRDVGDAEENLAEAQNEARIAQNALTGARQRAMETLEDLQFSLEGAVLSEEEAVLRLQRATEALAEVRANPASTAQELQEASLNYREAELALRMAQDALEDVQEEQAAAAAAGVEGSAEVVDAQNDIVDANNRVLDMQEALQRAEEDRADTAVQNARAIADAQERITEALEDQASASGGAKAAADAYEAALAKLSPPARAFVEYMVTLKDEVGKLRESAGAELFGPLKDGVQNVVTNFFPALDQALRITGAAIGDFATSITDVISSSDFVARFTQIAEDNTTTIQRFGEIIASVIDGISGVLVAAGPLIDRFTSFLTDKAQAFQDFATSGEGIEKMARFFEHAGDTAAKFGTIIGNVTSAFGDMLSAADESGQTMLDRLIGISERFEDFTSSISGHRELNDYFNQAGANASEVLGLIWDIVKAIGSLGSAPGVGQAAKTLREEWVPTLERIMTAFSDAGPALADLVVEVTNIAAAFVDTKSMETFLGVLEEIASLIAEFVESDFGSFFINLVGPIIATASALGLVFGVFKTLASVIAGSAFALGSFVTGVSTAMSAIGGFIAMVWTNVVAIAAQNTAMGATVGAGALMRAGLTVAAAGVRTLGAAFLAFMISPAGLAITAIAGLVAILTVFRRNAKEAEEETKEFNDTLDQTTGAATATTLQTYIDNLDNVSEATDLAKLSQEEWASVVSGGSAEIEQLENKLRDLGVSEHGIALATAEAEGAQEGYQEKLSEGKKAIEEHNALQAVATAEAAKHKLALDYLTIARANDNEKTRLAADFQDKLNDKYYEAVEAFTTLNKVGINQERTSQRVEAGYDDLADSIVSGSKAVKNYEGSIEDLTDKQLANLAAGDEAVKNLAIQEESGRAARSAILEMVEAADAKYKADLDAAAVSGDVAAATALATDEYLKSKQAIKDTATEMGVTEGAYDTFIGKITTPIEEQQIHFKLIWDEAQIVALTEDLPQNVLLPVQAQMEASGDYSPAGVARAIGKAMAKDPNLIADIPLQVREASVNQAIKDIDEVLVDPVTKKPREASILTGVDRDKYEDAWEILDAVKYDRSGNPRIAPYWTQAERDERTRLLAELEEIRMPGGKPRVAPISPDDQGRIDTINGRLKELEAKRTVTIAIELQATYASNIAKAVEEANRDGMTRWNNTIYELLAAGKIAWNSSTKKLYVTGKAEGGPITGPGGPTDDRAGLFRLSSGEYVLSAKAVQQLGGTATVDAFHKALKSGIKPPHLASGGIMPARSGGTLTMLAEGGKSERVEPLDANGLSAADRAILAALKDMKAQGFMVNIGMIQAPTPVAAAKEVVAAVRAETYRMGMFS